MPARPTDWIDTLIDQDVLSASGQHESLMTGVAPVNMRGMTLIRTIISLHVQSTTVAGAWGAQQLDIAIGVASQEAFASGSLPDPATATDKPARGWVWRHAQVVAQNGVGSVVTFPMFADIRGARKIENGELYLIMDNSPIQGTAFGINISGLVRTLYKL